MEEQKVTTQQTTQPDGHTTVTRTETGTNAPQYGKKKAVYRAYNIIWFIVGIVEVLLGFRFVFEMLGANQASGFTQLIYGLSLPFAQPFQSIFGITVVSSSIFDWSLLIAALVYLLVGYGLVQILKIVKPVTPDEVNRTVGTE